MPLGVIYALLSLLGAGVNDVVFKRYSRRERSRGMYICGIGVVWGALQLAAAQLRGTALAGDATTLGFGLLAGLLLTGSNILLLESLAHIDVSLGSTIYRLNTVGVVILSFLLLGEPLGLVRGLGILCGIAGVLLLYQRDTGYRTAGALFFAAAVSASLLRAGYGVTTRAGILQLADPQAMLMIAAASWIVGGAAYAALRERRFRMTKKKALYSGVSGLLVFLIANFLMLAVKHGQASIVIPIANLSFVVAVALSVALKMEALTLRKSAALLCAAGSILLLAAV